MVYTTCYLYTLIKTGSKENTCTTNIIYLIFEGIFIFLPTFIYLLIKIRAIPAINKNLPPA